MFKEGDRGCVAYNVVIWDSIGRNSCIARQIAMVSYRSHAAYQTKFGRRRVEKNGKEVDENEASTLDAKFAVRNYLEYQGK